MSELVQGQRSVQHIADDLRPGRALCGIEMPPHPWGPVDVHNICWAEWQKRRKETKRVRDR